MMITRRQFFVTIVIFLTLLLLFMGFQIGREMVSAPGVNKHIAAVAPNGKSSAALPNFYESDQSGKPEGLSEQDEWVLYLGEKNGAYAATAKEWSYYTKIPVVHAAKLPDVSASALPDIVMIEPDFVRGRSDHIAELMEKGVDFIFMSLPEYDYVTSDDKLRKILGIYRTVQKEIDLRGVHLFKGFLLGGERIFEEETAAEANDKHENRQDLELKIPWYSVRTRTKTYMRGTLSDEDMETANEKKYKNEDMPAIIWRSCFGNGEAYAVNGSYLKNRRAGMGILQAMMYERKPYSVYPVINAQVFSVAHFPILTDENAAQVEKIYGRTVTKAQTDIMLPMFITLASNSGKKPGFFLSVKYDRSDPAQPQKGILKTYLSMIDEMHGELALSADNLGKNSAGELTADYDFISSEAPDYRITAVMSAADRLSRLPETLEAAGARDIRTVSTSAYSESLPIFGYLNESVTWQQTTSSLKRHTFTDELELLGVQTLLAYSNSVCSMAEAFYPQNKKDEWQNSSRVIFSNLTTYSHPFRAEDNLTVTESDDRIRAYLGLQYKAERSGDVITVTSEGVSGDGVNRFILRTHDERIESVSGGAYELLEENAYLISAQREKTEIRLTSSHSSFVVMEGSNR